MESKGQNPKVINLSELPEEGRSYTYTRETAELNSSIADLLGDNPYTFKFHLQPLGNAFEMKGSLDTSLDLLCSRCAIDFNYRVSQDFTELLVLEGERPRGSQSAKPNHLSELDMDGPFCSSLSSDKFTVGDFLHEIIALAEPMQPLGKEKCDDSCENYQKAIKMGWLTPESELESEPDAANPFSALKGYKL